MSVPSLSRTATTAALAADGSIDIDGSDTAGRDALAPGVLLQADNTPPATIAEMSTRPLKVFIAAP